MQEYPKMLYRGADTTVCLSEHALVADAEQEKTARADGYEMYVEILAREHAPAPVAPVAAPEKRTYNRKAK